MKTLKGTEKQITWAMDIINNAVNTIGRNIELCEERNAKHTGMADKELKAWTALQVQVNQVIDSIEDASKIIALKDKFSPSGLIRLVNNNVQAMNK